MSTADHPPTDPGRSGLSALGRTTDYPDQYDPALLEVFANRHPDRDYWTLLECFEFTSLCPITGQPDWATILIRYLPDQLMLESKALKLYLHSFRNRGDFHEDVINIILNDLRQAMAPRYLEVLGIFHPRGGIAIHPFVNWGSPAPRIDAPEQTYLELARQRRDTMSLGETLQLGKHFR